MAVNGDLALPKESDDAKDKKRKMIRRPKKKLSFLQKRGTSLLNSYMDGRATTLHINEEKTQLLQQKGKEDSRF